MLSLCLSYLSELGRENDHFRPESMKYAEDLFERSLGINMTDTVSALAALNYIDKEAASSALQRFHDRFKEAPLVINKWLDIQASTPSDEALTVIQSLMSHPSFSIENPNNVYSSILAFAAKNTLAFHSVSGEGYRFLADQILRLDKINPMVAARVVGPLTHWRRYESVRSALMREQLERILSGHSDGAALSDNVREYLIKSLDD